MGARLPAHLCQKLPASLLAVGSSGCRGFRGCSPHNPVLVRGTWCCLERTWSAVVDELPRRRRSKGRGTGSDKTEGCPSSATTPGRSIHCFGRKEPTLCKVLDGKVARECREGYNPVVLPRIE